MNSDEEKVCDDSDFELNSVHHYKRPFRPVPSAIDLPISGARDKMMSVVLINKRDDRRADDAPKGIPEC